VTLAARLPLRAARAHDFRMVSAPSIDSFDELRLELRSEDLIRRDTRAVVVERVGRTSGLMTPLYASRKDETFHVRAGEVTFFVGAEIVRAGAGDVVVAPAGVPHALRVESPVARWLVVTDVASPARYDDFGQALGMATGEWATASDEATVNAIAATNRISVLGAPGTLPAVA
jgi:mannose-6-phosphate isomerase-like protein (cupin superfamily)